MNSLNLRLIVSYLLALALTILPLPELIVGIRPPWVLLLVLYTQFYLPQRFSLIWLALLGLLLDVLLSTVLGEHSFALALVSWVASTKSRRFRLFTISQQMALIGIGCLLYQLNIFFLEILLGNYASFYDVLGSAVLSVLLWPWLRLLTEDSLMNRVYSQA